MAETKTITMRVEPEWWERLKALAAERGQAPTRFLKDLVDHEMASRLEPYPAIVAGMPAWEAGVAATLTPECAP